jgi:hypothetical protein
VVLTSAPSRCRLTGGEIPHQRPVMPLPPVPIKLDHLITKIRLPDFYSSSNRSFRFVLDLSGNRFIATHVHTPTSIQCTLSRESPSQYIRASSTCQLDTRIIRYRVRRSWSHSLNVSGHQPSMFPVYRWVVSMVVRPVYITIQIKQAILSIN